MTSLIKQCFPFKKAKKRSRLYDLPTEILVNILEYLSPEDRQQFQQVSKYAASLVANFPSLTLSSIDRISIALTNCVQPKRGGKRLKVKDLVTNRFLSTKANLIEKLVIDWRTDQGRIAKLMVALIDAGRTEVDYLILLGYDGSYLMNEVIIRLIQPRKLFIVPDWRLQEIAIEIPASCSIFLFKSCFLTQKIHLNLRKATKLRAYCIYKNERGDCALQANHNVDEYQLLLMKALFLIPHLKDKMKLETEIEKLGNDVKLFGDIYGISHGSDNFLQNKTQ